MSLLTHIFGDKKAVAKKLAMNDRKRLALWNKHLSNYTQRELLSKHFSYANIDKALQDFDATDNVLGQIESLISPELINISDEEKLDRQILSDLKKLKSTDEIENLFKIVINEKKKQKALLSLFQEIHDILKVELHLIKLIRKKPSNLKELLLRLFKLIFHNEAMLYKVFKKESFFDKSVHTDVAKIARAIILQEKLKEEIETDEDKFVEEMVKKMGGEDTEHHYWKLGEGIYTELVEKAGGVEHREDPTVGIEMVRTYIKNTRILYRIIKKLRPKYDDARIKLVMEAFRKSFDLGHFMELNAEFVT